MNCKAARHPFTLIEVMIVLMLVGIIAGVTSFALRPLYQSYRFKLEVESLYELLQELQLEALTLGSDMKVSFTNDKGTRIARSFCEESVLKMQTLDLSHVESMDVISQIILYSNGRVTPPSLIKLSNKEEHRWIDLRGGHLIKLLDKEPQPSHSEKVSNINEIKRTFVTKEKA